MLNYHANDDLDLNARLNIYAPSGSYKVGRLANLGKNYWTFEPLFGFMYMGRKNGREASIFFGADFNTKNHATDYQTGIRLHLDGTLAQHFPLWGGLAGVGISGYWYEQITGDSGAGANLGDFEARTTGIGPAISYFGKIGDLDFLAELKWLHELDVENRPEGDFVWLKFIAKF